MYDLSATLNKFLAIQLIKASQMRGFILPDSTDIRMSFILFCRDAAGSVKTQPGIYNKRDNTLILLVNTYFFGYLTDY